MTRKAKQLIKGKGIFSRRDPNLVEQ